MTLQIPLDGSEKAETPEEGTPPDAGSPAMAYHLLRDVEVEITLEIGRR